MGSATDVSDPVGPKWVEETTALGGIPFMTLLVVLAGGRLFMNRRYETFVLLLFAMLGSLCLSFALKYAFDRPRSSLVPH